MEKLQNQDNLEKILIDKMNKIENILINIGESHQSPIMSVKDLRSYLKITNGTIYWWVYKNYIPYFKKGKHLLFSREEIDEWLRIGKETQISKHMNVINKTYKEVINNE